MGRLPQHWESMAEVWEKVGPPLRPSAEDQHLYWSLIDPWIRDYPRPRILLLGVTPELYRLPWPAEHDLLAIDRSREMIYRFWLGSPVQMMEADWTELPLPNESRDLAVCDGGLILLDREGRKRLADRLHSVLVPGGRCVFRLFIAPAVQETPAAILDDLFASRIPSLNILKLRLGPALRESPDQGTAMREVWKTLRATAENWETLAARLGWKLEELRAVDAYRDSTARYYYRSQAHLEKTFCAEGKFVQVGSRLGNYPYAERCPLVAFERR